MEVVEDLLICGILLSRSFAERMMAVAEDLFIWGAEQTFLIR